MARNGDVRAVSHASLSAAAADSERGINASLPSVRDADKKDTKTKNSARSSNGHPRLIVVSSKIKNIGAIQAALLNNVSLMQYKYDSATLEGLQASIKQQLGGKKVEAVAMVMHCCSSCIYLSAKDDKVLSKESIVSDEQVKEFFVWVAKTHVDKTLPFARLDILACNTLQSADKGSVCKDLEKLVQLPVGLSKDISGFDIPMDKNAEKANHNNCIGNLYFRLDKLRNWSGHNPQTLAGFEKIRTVGKGAYGTAVLYRKKDDDSLVILKEINLHDLSASERQLALNEVRVLAMLDHPNIISYYDSFEEDGIVMIEMEYADGGTLSQFLSQQDKPLEERQILMMFQQMVAAIRHIHEHNILHRDLKTANIFLTKEGVVKVGDFGISKLMSTDQAANTVLGTPYYISPEMCEGKAYNDKSDIWALGCILYEMACLQKTFEGSNLPALVNKIMKGQFAPVKGSYSEELKNLICEMLQREPESRPSARDMWHKNIPELLMRYEDPATDYEEDVKASQDLAKRKRKTRSVLYYFELSSVSLHPVKLPSKIRIRDVAVGNDHVIVVTVERMVFSWGQGTRGQLGHGVQESLAIPELVEALKGKSIIRACCGDGFSVFSSENGIVMTCGDGRHGCLGHDDWTSTSRPRLIEALLSVDVVAVASGPQHVVAVGSDGEVYSWGQGACGRLGLKNEENQCTPQQVTITDNVMVRDVRCGLDGTMLMTDVGSVLACGNNEHNKLGLNMRQGFLMAMKNIFNKTEVEGQTEFTLVRALARHRVLDISMGPDHSAVLVAPGNVYTFGKNTEGQLGNGNTKLQSAPIAVKIFQDKPAFRVQCGTFYSVAGTEDMDLLFWGMRFKTPPTSLESSRNSTSSKQLSPDARVESASSGRRSGHSRQLSATSIASLTLGSSGNHEITESGEIVNKETGELNHGQDVNSASQNGDVFSNNTNGGGFVPIGSATKRRALSASGKDRDFPFKDVEFFLHPAPLLRMDSSGSHSPVGETVTLSNFFTHGENLFIQVETTAPPPKRRSRRRRNIGSSNLELHDGNMRMSASSREGGDEYSSETSEYDTYGTIPAWIRQELAGTERLPLTTGGSDHSEDDEDDEVLNDSSMSSIQINKDLVARSRSSKNKNGGDPKMIPCKTDESGVELTPAEHLSSSSSSETMSPAISKTDVGRISSNAVRPPVSGGVRKVSAPAPYKSKAVPIQTQKPLTRIRAQHRPRTRGSDPKDPSPYSPEGREEMRGVLQDELERLKDEKKKTEERMRKIEEEHKQQQVLLKEETERKVKEKENDLKCEIRTLREELQKQQNKMQDNVKVMMSLQEQLGKVQEDQQKPSEPTAKSSVRGSSICSLQ